MIIIMSDSISLIEMAISLVLFIAIVYLLVVSGVLLSRRYEDWNNGCWWIWLGLIDVFAVSMICAHFVDVVLFGGF